MAKHKNLPTKTSSFIRKQWEKSIPDLKTDQWLGLKSSEIISAANEMNELKNLPVIEAWIIILDEFISYIVSINELISDAITNKSRKKPRNDLLVFWSLTSAIINYLFSIRHLIAMGFDMPARALVRNLREYLDVIILLLVEPDLIELYKKAETPEQSNAFWHQNVSKLKARKEIDKLFSSMIGADSWKEFQEWHSEENKIYSMSTHPTFMAGYMSSIGDMDDRLHPEWLGQFGLITNSSVRVLSYTMYSLLDIVYLKDMLLFGPHNYTTPMLKYIKTNEFHRHVKYGRTVLHEIMMNTSKNEKSYYPH